MKTLPIFIIAFILHTNLWAQVEAELSIENQYVEGTDFFFDIYLRRTAANPASGFLYPGESDFVITFNTASFTNPEFSEFPVSTPGNCLFKPTDTSGNNIFLTRNFYFSNKVLSIIGNQLVINMTGPNPQNQNAFNSRVAKVTQDTGMHRLGTFKITGLTGPPENIGLAWKLSGSGLYTVINSIESVAPWNSYPANVVATGPIPFCTSLTAPPNGSVNQPADTTLAWAAAAGNPAGYRLDVGTTPGGTDILNHFDVGDVTVFDPPGLLPYGSVIYVRTKPYNPNGISGSCHIDSFTTEISPPACTGLLNPANGSTDVPGNTSLTWAEAGGSPAGYRLDVGTTAGGTDIVNDLDVGNVTAYDPPGYLPYGTTIYVKIKPYNATGAASGCSSESFVTANCIPNLTIVSIPVPAGSHKSLGELVSNNSTIVNGTVVNFMSDTGVLLNQNFMVEPGSVFEVNIQSCPPPPAITIPPKQKKQ